MSEELEQDFTKLSIEERCNHKVFINTSFDSLFVLIKCCFCLIESMVRTGRRDSVVTNL